jgi:hypothetical protein
MTAAYRRLAIVIVANFFAAFVVGILYTLFVARVGFLIEDWFISEFAIAFYVFSVSLAVLGGISWLCMAIAYFSDEYDNAKKAAGRSIY